MDTKTIQKQNQISLFTALIEKEEKHNEKQADYLNSELFHEVLLLKMKIEQRIAKKKDDVVESNEDLKDLSSILDKLRIVFYELHPSLLKHFGLIKSFQGYALELSNKSGIQIKFNFFERVMEIDIEKSKQLHLYRLLTEVLNYLVARIQSVPIIVNLHHYQNKLVVEFGTEPRFRVSVPKQLKKLFKNPDLMSIRARMIILNAEASDDTDWLCLIKLSIPF